MKIKMTFTQLEILMNAIDFYKNFIYQRDFTALYTVFTSVKNTESFVINDDTYSRFREIIAPLQGSTILHEFGPIEIEISTTDNETVRIVSIEDKYIKTVIKCLDLYSRTLMGQFSVVFDDYRLNYWPEYRSNYRAEDEHLCILSEARNIIAPELAAYGVHGSYGIGSPEIPVESKIAYEMLGCMRYWLWLALEPDNRPQYGVNSHLPLAFSKEPFIEKL